MILSVKNILAAVLSAVIATSLCACSDGQKSADSSVGSTTSPVSENASIKSLVDSEMDELVEQSERFYNIYLRCNAETEEYEYSLLAEDENGFRYAPVKEFSTLSELKAETEKYFTKDGAQKLFYDAALNGLIPYYKEQDGKLVVIADYMSAGENKWVKGSAEITEEDGNTATVNVKYTDIYDTAKSADFSVVNDNGTLKITDILYNLK